MFDYAGMNNVDTLSLASSCLHAKLTQADLCQFEAAQIQQSKQNQDDH